MQIANKQIFGRVRTGRLLFVFGSLLICLFAYSIAQLYAQQAPKGITISPPTFEVALTPGKEIKQSIRIENDSDSTFSVRVEARNFSAQGEEGNVTLTPGDDTTTYSLASWITIDQTQFVLPSRGKKTVNFTIRVPQTAEAGGHFGSIVFATVPNAASNGTGAAVSQEIGALILGKIPGDANEAATLESFTSDKRFYPGSPASFTLRVKNESSIHIRPVGSITITDMFGRKDSTPIDSRNVLPGAIRKMSAVWNKPLMFGKYTATAFLVYGTNNKTMGGVVEFYAFPVKEGSIAFGVILILYLMRKRLFKAFKALLLGK